MSPTPTYNTNYIQSREASRLALFLRRSAIWFLLCSVIELIYIKASAGAYTGHYAEEELIICGSAL